MIVISGALVLVALVLLVLGLTMTDLDFVYGSIGVSLVSFVFLVIGILQRRGEQPAAAGAGPEVTETSSAPQVSDDAAPKAEPVTAPVPVAAAPATRKARVPAPVVQDDLDDEELEPGGGTVLVVPGRPRYHLEGCRYLTGKGAEPIDVLDAREDGFTPCGVCKPDAALAALAAEDEEPLALDEPAPLDDEPEAAPVADTGVPGTADEVDAAPAPARPRRTSRGSAALKAAPAEAPPAADVAAADGADADELAPPLVPITPPVAEVPPSPRARARSAATTLEAPAKPVGRTKVIVIPDRGRFHTPSCRFVRDVLGTEELTRAGAAKQGFKPCGVCKP